MDKNAIDKAIEILDEEIQDLVDHYIVNHMDKPTCRFVTNAWKIIKEKLNAKRPR